MASKEFKVIDGLSNWETSEDVITAGITSNSATTIDTTALSSFHSIEYNITIVQGSKIRTSAVLVQTDGTSVDSTEYGIVATGGAISGVVITATASGSNMLLQVTVTDAATTIARVRVVKNLLGVIQPYLPGAPTIGTVTSNSNLVSIPFTAPADNGNSSITSYTVTSSSGVTATGSSSPISLTEPVDGTYTYTITATNSIGKSISSATSNSVNVATITYYVGVVNGYPSIGNQYTNTYEGLISVGPSGSIYMGGQQYIGTGPYTGYWMRFSNNGNTVNYSRGKGYTPAYPSTYYASSEGFLLPDSNDNLYDGGNSNNTQGGTNNFSKFNSSGTRQWIKGYVKASGAVPYSQSTGGVIASDGNIIVSGNAQNGSSSGTDLFLMKTNPSDGSVVWSKTIFDSIMSSSSRRSIIYDMAKDSSDNYYVTGYNYNNNSAGYNVFIAKFNSSGNTVWTKRLSNTSRAAADQRDTGFSIALDSSGNVYVSGNTLNVNGGQNMFVTKYDNSGNFQWGRGYYSGYWAQDASNQYHVNKGLTVDTSDNLFISATIKAYVAPNNVLYGWVSKINTTNGDIVWQRMIRNTVSLSNQDQCGATDITSDSQNTLYVTGWIRNNSNNFLKQFILKVPNDGTKSGTYTIDSNNIVQYLSPTAQPHAMVAYTPSWSTADWSMTNNSFTYTDLPSNPSYTWSYTNIQNLNLGLSKVAIP